MARRPSLYVQVEKLRRELEAALNQPRIPKTVRQKLQKIAKDTERLSRELATVNATVKHGRFRLLVQASKELIVRLVELIWRSEDGT